MVLSYWVEFGLHYIIVLYFPCLFVAVNLSPSPGLTGGFASIQNTAVKYKNKGTHRNLTNVRQSKELIAKEKHNFLNNMFCRELLQHSSVIS